eukprot:3628028-Amphidinium_carterae.1
MSLEAAHDPANVIVSRTEPNNIWNLSSRNRLDQAPDDSNLQVERHTGLNEWMVLPSLRIFLAALGTAPDDRCA